MSICLHCEIFCGQTKYLSGFFFAAHIRSLIEQRRTTFSNSIWSTSHWKWWIYLCMLIYINHILGKWKIDDEPFVKAECICIYRAWVSLTLFVIWVKSHDTVQKTSIQLTNCKANETLKSSDLINWHPILIVSKLLSFLFIFDIETLIRSATKEILVSVAEQEPSAML